MIGLGPPGTSAPWYERPKLRVLLTPNWGPELYTDPDPSEPRVGLPVIRAPLAPGRGSLRSWVEPEACVPWERGAQACLGQAGPGGRGQGHGHGQPESSHSG